MIDAKQLEAAARSFAGNPVGYVAGLCIKLAWLGALVVVVSLIVRQVRLSTNFPFLSSGATATDALYTTLALAALVWARR